MESDITTEAESDLSDWDPAHAALTSENSEESDEYGIYYGDSQMYDTAIGGNDRFGGNRGYSGGQVSQDRYANAQMRKMISQLNSSHADSAYSGSGSLYPIHESSTDSSTSEQDDNNAEHFRNSPVEKDLPVYGRYQKFSSHDSDLDQSLGQSGDFVDRLMLHRLPGENLGMILGIEGGKDKSGKVSSVAVKSVTLGGAAYRATGSSKGVCVGDDIVEVNGLDLRTLTHDECVQVFKDMPLRVLLGIHRGQKDLPPVSISPAPMAAGRQQKVVKKQNKPLNGSQPVQITRRRDLSDSEDDGFGGFAIYQVTIVKEPEQNLGLSIVPSYGSTKEYYQIKRVLPSGAAAQSGQLEVGDRLITCNGTSLRGLTQNHCLDIIKSASGCGDIKFEVVRPVYNGNSMEISVTLNNGVNNRSLDPSQYSVKAQSYDRHGIDVVVTSESEDYLTVSEDEYTRTGRLANIPECEANEVFVSNSVRLAFQKGINTIDEESTETDTEVVQNNDNFTHNDGVEIVDLNKVDASPYHIPKRNNQNSAGVSQSLNLDTYRLATNTVSKPVYAHLDAESDQVVPTTNHHQSDIPCSNLDQVSPRSPIPSSHLDQISSPRSSLGSPRSPGLPRSNLDQISPRSNVPNTNLDDISANFSYSKRQQVPSESELTVPYNYPPGYVDEDIPVSDVEETRYNPLYEDSNLSEFTDSDTQDLYIVSPSTNLTENIPASDLDRISLASNRTLTRTDLDAVSIDSNWQIDPSAIERNQAISDSEEVAVPPPLEFCDDTIESVDNTVNYEQTYKAPLGLQTSEIPHIEEGITSFSNNYDHLRDYSQLNQNIDDNLSDSEQDDSELLEESLSEESDLDDAKLAFNSELTAPFDIVLQEQGISVQSQPHIIDDFDQSENEVLQVVTSYDDGTVVISQFEPENTETENIEPESIQLEYTEYPVEPEIHIPKYRFTRSSPTLKQKETDMDHNSEAMLKNALDMEYEQMAESNKFEARVKLGGHNGISSDAPNGFDDPSYENHNIVAENIAKDIVNTEKGGVGYFVESDDEPDQFPQADAPEEAPDIPDMPPPMLPYEPEMVSVTVNGVPVNGDLNGEHTEQSENEIVMDGNWCLKTKPVKHDIENKVEDEEIVPTKIQRKVEIPVKYVQQEDTNPEEIVVVPESFRRVFQLPEHFQERAPSPKQEIHLDMDFDEPIVTMTTKVVTDDHDSSGDEVEEETISPQEIKKDHSKNLVNVISVVNALKAAAKDKDPDEVDKIEKVDAKDTPKSFQSAVIKVGGKPTRMEHLEAAPPKMDQIVSSKDKITVSNKTKDAVITIGGKPTQKEHIETSPPKMDQIVSSKDKITVSNKTKDHSSAPKETEIRADQDLSVTPVNINTPVMKTNITVEKSKSEVNTNVSDSQELKAKVPPLKLEPVINEKSDSLSPKSDKSGGYSPTSSYKTTIGVTKPNSPKSPDITKHQETVKMSIEHKKSDFKPVSQARPNLAPAPLSKPLSQIKPLSFNPKSLSQSGSRSVQYKTTISTLGMKPSGLSSLSKPLAGSVKPDHPIKRMETLPFEVSILKGILGIGIKTVMTPEGYVKVTEILPTGPVGREGNIKVGDYILSINNTQLTGLTDGKVQQILRLLPRGLSKIVASAVLPDQASEQIEAQVEKPTLAARQSLPPSNTTAKQQLSPRQSSPLSSPRQPTVITNPNSHILLPRQQEKPVPVPRAISSSSDQQVKSPKSMPPVVAPRSINISTSTLKSPNLASKSPPAISPRSPSSKPLIMSTKPSDEEQSSFHFTSPLASPRQQESQQHSPRTPPPVAPKPNRSSNKISYSKPDDPNKPMEAEIFASVNVANETTPSGPNILPGLVNYDLVQSTSTDKTGWVPGMVSSADIKKGKTNVVSDTESQTLHVEHTVDTCVVDNAPANIYSNCNNNKTETKVSEVKLEASKELDQEAVIEKSEDDLEITKDDEKGDKKELSNVNKDTETANAVEKVSELEKSLDESHEVEGALLNRSRTFSTSSNASSYTEFTECDVEDEIIHEEIAEEDESSHMKTDDEETVDVNGDGKYESDFEEEDEKDSKETMKIRSLAENIVSNVISSIKDSDLLNTLVTDDAEQNADVAPPLPGGPPPLPVSDHEQNVSISTVEDTPPSDIPPPLPTSPTPGIDSDNTPATVVDLALYPDSDQSCEDNHDKTPQETNEVVDELTNNEIDVVNVSVTSNLHAEAPISDMVNVSSNVGHSFTDDVDSSIPQVAEDKKQTPEIIVQTEAERISSVHVENDDQSVSNVISMYSNLESSWHAQHSEKEEPNNNVYKTGGESLADVIENGKGQDLNVTEVEDCASNISVAGSDSYRDDNSMIDGLSSGFNSRRASCDDLENHYENDMCDNQLNDNTELESSPVNGVPDVQNDNQKDNNVVLDVYESQVAKSESENTELAKDDAKNIDEADGRPIVVSAREGRPKSMSRVDELLSQVDDAHHGKYSPELDRMIKMLSTDEPEQAGEGEITHITLNKGVTGLGFLIQGGKSTPKGDMPLTIKKIFKGGPADGILQVRDEICEVNGEDMADMRHSEAWNHLKFLPSGDVVMKIRRFTSDSTDV